MKKMIAFVMALALVCTNVPANLHVQTGTETVYAAQETAINSEQALIVRSKIMRESSLHAAGRQELSPRSAAHSKSSAFRVLP